MAKKQTEKFNLQPVDILVNINSGTDPWARARRWAIGPYSHVFMYLGEVGLYMGELQPRIMEIPMLFESNGRGVVIQALSNRYGQEVVVMRLRWELNKEKIPRILYEAVKLASDPQSQYDYMCIPEFILPRVILEKLNLPMPLKYQRNPAMVCSEAIFEVFYRAELTDILPKGIVPLPGDFIYSPLLVKVWEGKLSPEWI